MVKPFPSMWMRIAHAVSGVALFVSAMIHIVGQMRVSKS